MRHLFLSAAPPTNPNPKIVTPVARVTIHLIRTSPLEPSLEFLRHQIKTHYETNLEALGLYPS